jgi:hypothetical protein
MWFIWVVVGLILLLVLAALFLPLEIEFDSESARIQVGLLPLARFTSELPGDDITFGLKVLGREKRWSLLEEIVRKRRKDPVDEKKASPKEARKKKRAKRPHIPLRRAFHWLSASLTTFDPIVWRFELDPGPVMYGIAYPLQSVKWKGKYVVHFNLNRRNILQFRLRNYLARILWVGIVHGSLTKPSRS